MISVWARTLRAELQGRACSRADQVQDMGKQAARKLSTAFEEGMGYFFLGSTQTTYDKLLA